MSTPTLPDPALVQSLLHRYEPVRLQVEDAHLLPGDRRALRKLVEASAFIDSIFWRQHSEIGTRFKDSLSGRHDDSVAALRRLLEINFGPWDTLNDDRPFWGDLPRAPGGSLYPADLTRAELDAYLQSHPDERQRLLSPTTLVTRQNGRLSPLPYAEAYRDELAAIAQRLVAASELASDARFRAFLRTRANDLLSDDLSDSERQWIALGSSPIDIAIGPYEVYDDGLLGLKASYESTVLVRHPLSDRVAEFEAVLPQLEHEMPGVTSAGESQRRISIAVYDVVHAAGMTNLGAKAVAAMLPNDERIRTEVGGRLLLFNNVATAKYNAILLPVAQRVLTPADAELVQEEAFVLHTILHEAAHALSPGFVLQDGRRTAQTINQALRERYSTIEESRADLVGLAYLSALIRSGMIPATSAPAACVTFVANCMRTLRFGLGSDYACGAALALTHLRDAGAVRVKQGKLAVAADTAERAIHELATTVQAIATNGDYQGAVQLIARLAHLPREIAPLLATLDGLPVDLEFVFDDSGLALA